MPLADGHCPGGFVFVIREVNSQQAAGAVQATVKDKRCRAGRLAVLIPLNAEAAALDWWLAEMTRNSMRFGFASAPQAEARFGWALIGDGGTAIPETQEGA